MSIYYGVSADGRRVAEAEVAGVAAARDLVAAAVAAGCELAWAHSAADLSGLGFCERPGYRRLTGPARPGPLPEGVAEVPAGQDTAQLCAAAYCGQWGHKTPAGWPAEDLAGSRLLGLEHGGMITGICRVWAADGRIDAPGLIPGQGGQAGYRVLLAAGLSQLPSGSATVDSWGDGPDRVRACEELGLVTAEYCPGWELDLTSRPQTG